ncbi:hypothetical protein IE53DRAFT_216250 [Violaceomyces palustris]|uniref:Uncharacterized protein n=1 Tax=Violaceomyces palustris TaxID=1673888 RepID=A0ACD0P897_9BASI|nr:hypothetical protein IE53DRAFT_216250 [Violaceomyces palustris]
MPELTSTLPSLVFEVTLNDASSFLALNQEERPLALAFGAQVDTADGAWLIRVSRPHLITEPSKGDKATRANSCLTLQLVAKPTITERSIQTWTRVVHITVDTLVDDFRSSKPLASAKVSTSHSFSSASPSCDISVPTTELPLPDKLLKRFNLCFAFTLQGCQVYSSAVPTKSLESPIPSITVDALAMALRDGVWGDVGFLLEDPTSPNGYAQVFANSSLICKRSTFFRNLLYTYKDEGGGGGGGDEASKGTTTTAAGVNGHHDWQNKALSPHEFADSDCCIDLCDGGGAADASDRTCKSREPPTSQDEERREFLPELSRPLQQMLSLGRFRRNRFRGVALEHKSFSALNRNDTSGRTRNHGIVGPATFWEPKRQNGTPRVRYIAISDAAVTTFRRVIFWLETDQIVFAPLSSDDDLINDSGGGGGGSLRRERFIDDFRTVHPSHPDPASAKSIYRLAVTYDLPELRDLAFDFIRSQLKPSNVLRELFSPFSLKFEPVKELELDFAIRHWHEVRMFFPDVQRILERCKLIPEAANLLSRIFSMTTMPSIPP